MAYSTGDIRAGSHHAASAAASADAALNRLLGSSVRAAAFGEVQGAERLAAGLGTSRDGYARTSFQVHSVHVGLDTRAQQIARQGDELVPETTAIAHSVQRSIRDQM